MHFDIACHVLGRHLEIRVKTHDAFHFSWTLSLLWLLCISLLRLLGCSFERWKRSKPLPNAIHPSKCHLSTSPSLRHDNTRNPVERKWHGPYPNPLSANSRVPKCIGYDRKSAVVNWCVMKQASLNPWTVATLIDCVNWRGFNHLFQYAPPISLLGRWRSMSEARSWLRSML